MNRLFIVILTLIMLPLAACTEPIPDTSDEVTEALVVYSGRSKALVDEIVERFEEETGISVDVRYGDTAQLAVTLAEEGAQTRADVFWAQDAGALGAVDADGLFATLPDSILQKAPAAYRSAGGTWVGTSARARTLAYSLERADTTDLPTSLFDLTDPKYAGRVGWAPANGSFQAHVTALRAQVGEDETRAWLEAMKANGAKAYPKNSAIVQAIADGEVDYGLPNHYYLYRFTSEDAAFPVAQTFFEAGDAGNLVNVAGAGILASSDNQPAAERFLSYLLNTDAQHYFTQETFEYSIVEGIKPGVQLLDAERLETLQAPVDLASLRDLEATLQLLRDTELL